MELIWEMDTSEGLLLHSPSSFLANRKPTSKLEEWCLHLCGKTVVQVGCAAQGESVDGSQIGNATHPSTSTKSKVSPDFLLLGFFNLLGFFRVFHVLFCFSFGDDSMIYGSYFKLMCFKLERPRKL